MTDKKSKKLIVVLGMHRSGTSVITRALEVMGVQLGNRLLPPMKDVNEKGFWEDIDINALNIEMLEALHLTWHHLVPIQLQDIEVLRQKGFVTRALELLHQKIENVPVFAFKDPSVAKLLPFWQEVLHQCQCEVNFVVAIRHPLSVVQSLAKRDGFDDEKSYSLWLGYVITSLCCLTDGNKSVFVDYDRVMNSPESELNRIADSLQLVINPASLTTYQSEFLDKKLRHTTYTTKDVLHQENCPVLVSDIYEALLDAATDAISIADPVLQDQIRQWEQELKSFHPLFTLADRLYLQKADAIAERDKKIGDYHQTVLGRDKHITDLNKHITDLNKHITDLNKHITDLNKSIADCNERIVHLHQTVVDRDTYIAQLGREVADKEQIINQAFSSRSWRLTRPLRECKPFIKKMLGCKTESKSPPAPSGEILPSDDSRYVTNWHLMLPASPEKPVSRKIPQDVVDIIIPVYRGLEQTQRCILSVLQATVASPYRLIIINDMSPENEITEYLRSLSGPSLITVIENDENLGFTATVNKGITFSGINDVILLNSDTEVANNWLDKLKRQAYSELKIGTVTPFSNNATICSYPTLHGMKQLPVGETVGSMDTAFAQANNGRHITIPTAVGFCMYIRRDCLHDVGLFDVETFGKGYGEENDFCLRATAKGWKHVLAADTFVYHEGEVSFQEGSNPRKERAMTLLRERYPEYENNIIRHITRNEAHPLRIAATAARFKRGNLPVVLHILHAHGGGTEKHIEELCRRFHDIAKLLLMTPPFVEKGKTTIQIRSTDPADELDLHLSQDTTGEFMVSLLRSFGVSLVHFHHILGYSFDFQQSIQKLEVPFYLTIHDYMLICPRINLMPAGQGYCGEPKPDQCNRCLAAGYPLGAGDIVWWRERHGWIFNEAEIVICPSYDVARRCRQYYPEANYLVVNHENLSNTNSVASNRVPLNEDESLRIAILGVLARHKGFDLMAETVLTAEKAHLPLQFQLIGYTDSIVPVKPSTLFSQTGRYADTELNDKINNFNPHLILFPAIWPETYSYTLTAAIQSNRPIMATDLGAFPERLASRPWSWLLDWHISGDQLAETLCKVRNENFLQGKTPSLALSIVPDVAITVKNDSFYDDDYMLVAKTNGDKKKHDIRQPGKITAIVVLENAGDQPSPCAYIRLILPLIRERGAKLDLRWVTPDNVTSFVADILICQRTAVPSITAINSITAHCQANQMRIVYDLDDLLLALPDEHSEQALYASKSAAVFRWILEAHEVWVSTETLRQHVLRFNTHTFVVPNYIDEALWTQTKDSAPPPNEDDGDPIRLLYMGTHTHGADFEFIRPVLKRLKEEFSSQIEICLIGVCPHHDNTEWYRHITPPQEIGANYPAFVRWLVNTEHFDIGLAPLIDNTFNRCKSAIKFLDYSALHMVTVASDLNGYAPIVSGENGFRVQNTEEAWYEALKKLIVNKELRVHLRNAAHNTLTTTYHSNSVTGQRTKRMENLLHSPYEKKSLFIQEDTPHHKDNLSGIVGRNMIASAFLSGEGIEIGALHNPLPVASEVKVRYVDRMGKAALYKKYPELLAFHLVDVDHEDDGESLLTFADNSQDFIIANHFLEYCEDPIATLHAFCRVLKNNGILFLALPDKRYCFDKNRQQTTLEHVVRDHLEGPSTSRFHHFCEWPEFVEPHFGRIYKSRQEIETRAKELMSTDYSIRYHAWEPDGVSEMIRYCIDKQGLPFVISFFLSTDKEMIIIVRSECNRATFHPD